MRCLLAALLLSSAVLGACAAPFHAPAANTTATGRLATEATLPIQKGAESRLRLQPEPAKARGTLVMYHGFSAGTWQFDLLAERFFTLGYNVYVPRLPGHGFKLASGKEDGSQLPLGGDWTRYVAFAEETYAEATGLGAPVSTLGLSVGGDVALYVAEKHPEVQRTVLYAPFLRHRSVSGVFDNLALYDRARFGEAEFLLDRIGFGWGAECEADGASGKRPGHCNFVLGNIQGVLSFGRVIVDGAASVKSPVQFFVTEVDDVADEDAMRRSYEAMGAAPTHGWYYYPAGEGIPHPMLHPMEDKGKGHTPKLYEMTEAFIVRGELQQRAKP